MDQRNEIEKPTLENPRGKGARSMTFQPGALTAPETRTDVVVSPIRLERHHQVGKKSGKTAMAVVPSLFRCRAKPRAAETDAE